MTVVFYSLSPTLAVVFGSLAVAYFASFFTKPYGFATLSNLSFVLSALWREAAAARGRSTSAVAGELNSGCFPLLLLGASSLAFHKSSELDDPAHTLDVFAGWLLVLHLCYCALSIAVLCTPPLLGLPHSAASAYRRWLRPLLSIGFVSAVALLAVFFEEIYSNQLSFYFSVGPTAALFGAFCRMLLTEGESGVGLALFELLVALVVVTAAVFAQGELVGRTLTAETAPELYDLFHGSWHVLLSAVAAVVYARSADAGRLLMGRDGESAVALPRCVCRLPVLDWLGEALLLLLAVVVLVTKEANAAVGVARAWIGVCAGLGLVHAVATVVMVWNDRVGFFFVDDELT